jgi:atlastin
MIEEINSNGRPIPVLISKKKHEFALNEEALKDVFLQDHAKYCYAVVLSVPGPFRQGKSFLLNFFLRYLNHTVCNGR